MKFIQVAPDETYFHWQWETQALNAREVGMEEDMIILVALKPGQLPSEGIKKFQLSFKGEVHFYTDERVTKHYLPSIRPHLIKKYLKEHPIDVFFYGDADIIFLKNPDLDRFKDDNFHYVAKEAQGYTFSKYIKGFPVDLPNQKREKTFFRDLFQVIDGDTKLYEDNDDHCGGAQYIIRGTDYAFWDKVERRCEAGYKWVLDNTREDDRNKVLHYQIWGIDLAVLFLSLLETGIPVRHLHELSFLWPYSTYQDAEKGNYYIMHNAGIDHTNDMVIYYDVYEDGKKIVEDIKKEDFQQKGGVNYQFIEKFRKRRYFNKDNYRQNTPYNVDHSYLQNDFLQTKYVGYFKHLKSESDVKRRLKILVTYCTTYGREHSPIHPELLKASLNSVVKAAKNSKDCDVEVVACSWKKIPDCPVENILSPFRDLGHLNYILQLKQIVIGRQADVIAICEHDALYPEDYFDEMNNNWNYGKYAYNARNYIGINKTGYLDVVERHHPFSLMGFSTNYFHQLMDKKVNECISRIGDWGGAAVHGWTCIEPDNKGEMHDHWNKNPMVHVSMSGTPFAHHISSHDLACYERESKGKLDNSYWGNVYELLPFLKELQ